MKLLVTGGRNYDDWDALRAALDEVHAATPVDLVVHGDYDGADQLARRWAERRRHAMGRVWHAPCPADWDQFDKAAGPIRNSHMLDVHRPDLVVAFPGGRGTANMVEAALRWGVRVKDLRSKA